nr:MAG TPA: hypothetical protein [Caudoviricetes sp.]
MSMPCPGSQGAGSREKESPACLADPGQKRSAPLGYLPCRTHGGQPPRAEAAPGSRPQGFCPAFPRLSCAAHSPGRPNSLPSFHPCIPGP